MTTATRATKTRKSKEAEKDLASTYDEFKQFEGKRYTGMKIGRSHKWYYDKGEWKEKKVTPDLWEVNYAVTKRRAGKAPEGSGVPVGTEYHWYIAAHQNVRKLNANDYSTSLTGLKFKIAHKRADTEKWSASDRAQRKRLIKFLEGLIEELRGQEAETPVKPVEMVSASAANNGNGRHRHAPPHEGNGRAAATRTRQRRASPSTNGSNGNGHARGHRLPALAKS